MIPNFEGRSILPNKISKNSDSQKLTVAVKQEVICVQSHGVIFNYLQCNAIVPLTCSRSVIAEFLVLHLQHEARLQNYLPFSQLGISIRNFADQLALVRQKGQARDSVKF